MRKDRFGDGLLYIVASAVATLGSWFRFHGSNLGNGAEKEQMNKDLQLPLLRRLTSK